MISTMVKKRVILGMSGGVDSSVSALLLKQEGYEVIGLFMKNWEETSENGMCNSQADFEDVQRVCDHLQIPYYTINFVKEYQEAVFKHFIQELEMGFTPNPDILCNREIKFHHFFQKALQLDADYVATGHYACIHENQLRKSRDLSKDQTYFLYTLKEQTLKSLLFPIGHLEKSMVRQIAKEAGLPTHAKKDSTGICFIGKRDFKSFISHYIPYQSGNFETLEGKVVGTHDGAAYYTIGQRKGLKIGGAGKAWFVVGKDMKRNAVFVQQGQDHPALYAKNLCATEASWIANHPPSPLPFSCKAKIRYRQEDQPCRIEEIQQDQLIVSFLNPQRAITPRQSIVFYDNEVCLGGAFIKSSIY